MSRQANRQTQPIQALQAQHQRFRSISQSPSTQSQVTSKLSMQQLYKNQLDSLMNQKNSIKQAQRSKQQSQRKLFNDQVQQSKQADRVKQMSYKNYYNMLMSNQNNNQQQFVSVFSKGDHLKDSLINKNIQDQKQRRIVMEQEMIKRQMDRKNNYRNQLMQQISDRRKNQMLMKNQEVQEKQLFQMNSKVPLEVYRQEKQKHKDQLNKYRADLDTMRQSSNGQSSGKKISLVDMRSQYHNILTNPMPFNIQNPYILKEMGMPKNPSYLAMKGSQNLKMS